jgi:DNA-binding response OmpR family regulator
VTILIVEDEVAISKMYQFKLEKEGFTVHYALNGQDGLIQAEKYRPDLILLDLRMPIMNGDEMLKLLRAKDWGGSIRVFILTNISRDEAPSSLRVLNVDRYIVKAHHTPSQIVQMVSEVLSA